MSTSLESTFPVAMIALSSLTDALSGCATGALLRAVTASAKLWFAEAPARSVAMMFTSRLPRSPPAGVPLKVRATASKLSQAGSGSPLASVAL